MAVVTYHCSEPSGLDQVLGDFGSELIKFFGSMGALSEQHILRVIRYRFRDILTRSEAIDINHRRGRLVPSRKGNILVSEKTYIYLVMKRKTLSQARRTVVEHSNV